MQWPTYPAMEVAAGRLRPLEGTALNFELRTSPDTVIAFGRREFDGACFVIQRPVPDASFRIPAGRFGQDAEYEAKVESVLAELENIRDDVRDGLLRMPVVDPRALDAAEAVNELAKCNACRAVNGQHIESCTIKQIERYNAEHREQTGSSSTIIGFHTGS